MAATFTHILCPTDYSEGARRALDYAAALARHSGAHLSVAHAWGGSEPATLLGDAGALALAHEDARARATEQLNAAVSPLRAQGAHVATVPLEGSPVPALLGYMAEERVDLLVLGTHGRSGFERVVLGSVTEKLLRKATCPVLTIPPTIAGGDPRVGFRHVLCAVDDVSAGDPTIATALWLAQREAGQLTLLHVVQPLTPPPGLDGFDTSPYVDRVSRDWLSALESSVGTASRAECRVVERVAIGQPPRSIVDTATQTGADVIVMGVRGRGAVDLMLLGSTTHFVVRHARCPVLTVRLPT